MQISPLTPRLGAEISDIDIGDLDDSVIDQMHQLWLRYKVLFLRDQALDLDELQHFSRRFGELMQLPFIKPHPDYPCIQIFP